MADERSVHHQYTVAWICALELELAAAQAMLDERHSPIAVHREDTNTYRLGRVGEHNVVIACLPSGKTGSNPAAVVATNLLRSFPAIRFGLMIGIGGGVPSVPGSQKISMENDVRLGDVVISTASGSYGGVIQYDYGSQLGEAKFVYKGSLNNPPTALSTAVTGLRSDARLSGYQIQDNVAKVVSKFPKGGFKRPDQSTDRLFKNTYTHTAGQVDCSYCEDAGLIDRTPRVFTDPVVHYGLIGSANMVLRDPYKRDKLQQEMGIICYEMEAAGLMNDFPCLVIRGISDYCDSHKSDLWQPYAAAVAAAYAKELVESIPPLAVKKTIQASEVFNIAETTKRSFIKAISTCSYQERKDRNRRRVEGTCIWFTQHALFRDWRQSSKDSLLWASADPGCGKSVLARFLIDDFLKNESKNVFYFFFKDDFKDQRTSANAACALLRQLLTMKPELFTRAMVEDFLTNRVRYNQWFSDLWKTFLDACARTALPEIICIFDAFDECQKADQPHFLEAISQASKGHHMKMPLKILVTSRPYGTIRDGFRQLSRTFPVIHLSGESDEERAMISREIDIVIKQQISDFCQDRELTLEDKNFLLAKFVNTPQRTYLWAHLTLTIVRETPGFTRGNVRRVIEELPSTVDDAYEKILERSADKKKAKLLLHLILAAQRPLNIEEMSILCGLEPVQQSYGELQENVEPERRFRNTVRDLCGLFVVIVDSQIYFLHQTAREFLIMQQYSPDDARDVRHASMKWRRQFNNQTSNRLMADRCLQFLCLDGWKNTIFEGYAAQYWFSHFGLSDIREHDDCSRLAIRVCSSSSVWYRDYLGPPHFILDNVKPLSEELVNDSASNALVIPAFLGLSVVIKTLLYSSANRYGRYEINVASKWAREMDHAECFSVLSAFKAQHRPVSIKSTLKMIFGRSANV